MRYFIFCFYLFSTTLANAESVHLMGTPASVILESGLTIPVYKEATIRFPNPTKKELKLGSTGEGIREKKILIASVNVYHVQSFTDLPNGIDAKSPLESLSKANARLLTMTFMRDLDSEKIRSSFFDALKENGVNTESEPMKQVAGILHFDVKKGGSMYLLGLKEGSGEVLYFLSPEMHEKVSGPTVVTDFWKIWFGKPADGGLEDLQKKLVF